MAQLYKYLVLDAARMDDKIDEAKELCPKFHSLYRGDKENQLQSVAPYVFDGDECKELQDFFFDIGWGDSWGIMLYTRKDLSQVRKHLRRFLMVQTEDKRELYFRFYDPRVLRVFLPTCDAKQLNEFFGPIQYFLCEDEDPEQAILFSLEGNKLVSKFIAKEEAQGFKPVGKKGFRLFL